MRPSPPCWMRKRDPGRTEPFGIGQRPAPGPGTGQRCHRRSFRTDCRPGPPTRLAATPFRPARACAWSFRAACVAARVRSCSNRYCRACDEHADVFLLGAGADAHAFFGMLRRAYRARLPARGTARHACAARRRCRRVDADRRRDVRLHAVGIARPRHAGDRNAHGRLRRAHRRWCRRIPRRCGCRCDRRARRRTGGASRSPAARARPSRRSRANPIWQRWPRPMRASSRLPERDAACAIRSSTDRHGLATAGCCGEARSSGPKGREAELRPRARSQRSRKAARRGEWGHGLDRELVAAREQLERLEAELDERTEWALALDAEVEATATRSLDEPARGATPRRCAMTATSTARPARCAGLSRQPAGRTVRRDCAAAWPSMASPAPGRASLRELRRRLDRPARETFAEPSEEFSPFAFRPARRPRVSIIIPVHNKFAYTAACLRSLADACGGHSRSK